MRDACVVGRFGDPSALRAFGMTEFPAVELRRLGSLQGAAPNLKSTNLQSPCSPWLNLFSVLIRAHLRDLRTLSGFVYRELTRIYANWDGGRVFFVLGALFFVAGNGFLPLFEVAQ